MRIEELFVTLFNMSITAGYVVLAVVLLRLLLKKAPRWISRALWALVGLRLVLPFSIDSVLSLIPSSNTVTTNILYSAEPSIHSGFAALNSAVNPVITGSLAPAVEASVNPMQLVMQLAGSVWLAGLLAMALYGVMTYRRLRRRVDSAVLMRDNIFESDAVASPFILGILRPRIYLPFDIGDADRTYVLSHEQTHIRRKDHWIKPLGFLLLTVYWFNPLIWAAYILLCRDIELACDEAVIRDIGGEEKKAYSTALLDCAVNRRSIALCPLAFGEVGLKARVKNVLNYKKPAFWIIAVAVAASIVAGVCLLTNPGTGGAADHPMAARLYEYRTVNGGDNDGMANIVSLVRLLDFPPGVKSGQIKVTVDSASCDVVVYCMVTPEVKAAYDTPEPENIGVFRQNACILLSLVKNAGQITFRLDDGTGSAADLPFTRDWAESVVGADLWDESGSVDRLDSLLTRISEHVESAYTSAAEVTVGEPPAGTFTPTAMVYLGPWFSVTPDGFLENNDDRAFVIDLVKFNVGGSEYSVRYKPVDVGDAIQTFGEGGAFDLDVSGFSDKAGWSVIDVNGEDTGYRIFRLDGEIWIGHWSWYGAKHDAWWCEYIFKVGGADDAGFSPLPAAENAASDNTALEPLAPSSKLEIRPSSDGVDDFLQLLGTQRPSGYDNDTCFNITPDFVGSHSPYRIFKFSQSCASYLLYGDAVYPLGEYFGGSGIDSVALADLNRNGQYELYFTFSWGSGLHRSQLGYFNPQDNRVTVLERVTALEPAILNSDCILTLNADNALCVSTAELVFVSDGGFVSFDITAKAQIGFIIVEDGVIQYSEK
jgi:beta-lactamase regulating signal transducer with metallopeptidase domain